MGTGTSMSTSSTSPPRIITEGKRGGFDGGDEGGTVATSSSPSARKQRSEAHQRRGPQRSRRLAELRANGELQLDEQRFVLYDNPPVTKYAEEYLLASYYTLYTPLLPYIHPMYTH